MSAARRTVSIARGASECIECLSTGRDNARDEIHLLCSAASRKAAPSSQRRTAAPYRRPSSAPGQPRGAVLAALLSVCSAILAAPHCPLYNAVLAARPQSHYSQPQPIRLKCRLHLTSLPFLLPLQLLLLQVREGHGWGCSSIHSTPHWMRCSDSLLFLLLLLQLHVPAGGRGEPWKSQ